MAEVQNWDTEFLAKQIAPAQTGRVWVSPEVLNEDRYIQGLKVLADEAKQNPVEDRPPEPGQEGEILLH